jgi:hypothetical protein
MYKSFIASLTTIALLFPAQLLAIPCINAFEGKMNQFQLFEQLDCQKAIDPVLQITAVNASANPADPYLKAGCAELKVYLSLYKGDTIIAGTDMMSDSLSRDVEVQRYCDGQRLFRIDRAPLEWTLPSGEKVSTHVRFFEEDKTGELLAYIRADEDDNKNKQVVLRSTDSAVLAVATINRVTDIANNKCYGVWTVTNNAGTEQVATMMSFILSLKENRIFSCVMTQPPQPVQGPALSTPAALAIGAAAGAVITLSGVAVYFMWVMKRASARPSEADRLVNDPL